VFDEELRYLIFRPYWNVPRSIVLGEILPALARDSTYLERENMEIVSGLGDDAPRVPVTPDAIAGLRAGSLRLRQIPGPKNSLGLLKFVFPNDSAVYLHDTPTTSLFARSRRDFSHGCVRVKDPVGLAAWLLRDQPGWSRARIVAAMHGADSQRVDLTQSVQAILFYVTAAVEPEDGAVVFAEDIYGHDARLDHAMEARSMSTP
jgi:murein L,D-transpeptidase YcbB/YkuD